MGWEPWSWSQALGSASPLNAVQNFGLDPLISIPGDHVAPPSVDWLKKMGLSAPTPCPVSALNRVHTIYRLSAFGLSGLESPTMSSLSLAMLGFSSRAATPIGTSR